MSSTKKILILLALVLLTVGFLVAGVLFDSNKQVAPGTSKLGALLQPMADSFVPKMPLSNVKCNNQKVTSHFKLTEARTSCRFGLNPSSGDDYAKARISVTGGNAKLYFVARLEEREFSKSKRDRQRYFLDQSALSQPFILARWEPTDGEDPRDPNWLAYILTDSPGELIALDSGGHLTLECVGCTDSQNVKIRMY